MLSSCLTSFACLDTNARIPPVRVVCSRRHECRMWTFLFVHLLLCRRATRGGSRRGTRPPPLLLLRQHPHPQRTANAQPSLQSFLKFHWQRAGMHTILPSWHTTEPPWASVSECCIRWWMEENWGNGLVGLVLSRSPNANFPAADMIETNTLTHCLCSLFATILYSVVHKLLNIWNAGAEWLTVVQWHNLSSWSLCLIGLQSSSYIQTFSPTHQYKWTECSMAGMHTFSCGVCRFRVCFSI